jgi:hypothetical protein
VARSNWRLTGAFLRRRRDIPVRVAPQAQFQASITGTLTIATASLATKAAFAASITGTLTIGSAGLSTGVVFTDSRLNIMRLAAARLGTFTPTAQIKINGTRRETDIDKQSVQITYDIDAPTTALLRVVSGTKPVIGQDVIISLGEPTNRLFGGVVVRVTQKYLADNPKRAANIVYDCECQDYTWLLNRRVAYGTFSAFNGQSFSARAIAVQLVNEFSDGSFNQSHIDDCGEVPEFDAGWRGLADALRELANAVGAKFSVDPYKGIHLGITDRAPNPHPLAVTDDDFRDMNYTEDLSQTRTVVYAFGGTLTVAADTSAAEAGIIPLQSVDGISTAGIAYIDRPRRKIAWSNALLGPYPYVGNYSTVTVAATPTAASLSVAECSVFPQSGAWLQCGNNTIRYTTVSATNGPGTLNGIPFTGPGAVFEDIKAGDEIKVMPQIQVDGGAGSAGGLQEGDTLRFYGSAQDSAAITALAALEGGDGVREVAVDGGGSLDITRLGTRSQAELDKTNETTVRLTYRTRDPNALPGRFVTAAITGTYPVSATFRIARVTIRDINFVAPTDGTSLPWREVEASTEQTSMFDLFGRTLNAAGSL